MPSLSISISYFCHKNLILNDTYWLILRAKKTKIRVSHLQRSIISMPSARLLMYSQAWRPNEMSWLIWLYFQQIFTNVKHNSPVQANARTQNCSQGKSKKKKQTKFTQSEKLFQKCKQFTWNIGLSWPMFKRPENKLIPQQFESKARK